jgi:hypothetical protein
MDTGIERKSDRPHVGGKSMVAWRCANPKCHKVIAECDVLPENARHKCRECGKWNTIEDSVASFLP